MGKMKDIQIELDNKAVEIYREFVSKEDRITKMSMSVKVEVLQSIEKALREGAQIVINQKE